MNPDHEARRIAADVLDDFQRMFPGRRFAPPERQYLATLIVLQVRDALGEALAWDEDDHR